MRLGAENRNTVIAAIVLGIIALGMAWRTFFGSGGEVIASGPPAPAATSTVTPGPPARILRGGRRVTGTSTKATVTASLDPRLRFDLLRTSEQTEYKGAGRNIFHADAEIPIPTPHDSGIKEQAKVTPPPEPVPQPYVPPPPPPINLKFFGFANRPGEPRQVFLLQNDDVFIAKEGDVVNRRYKVVKINNTSVEIEDLLGNNQQTVPLTTG